MRIRELLGEAAKNSKEIKTKQTAEPPKDELDPELDDLDRDEDTEDAEDSDQEGTDFEPFKKLAGRLGKDLYSVSAYDYTNEFSSVGPNSVIKDMLEGYQDEYEAVKNYLSVDLPTITEDKVVSAIILNERTGEFFGYYAGTGGALFSPSMNRLKSDGWVEADQQSVLDNIDAAGKYYSSLVKRIDWDAGSEASNPKIYDRLDALTYALKLPDLPAKPRVYHDDELSPEELKQRKAFQAKFNAGLEDELAQFRREQKARQKEIEKTGGAGREKR